MNSSARRRTRWTSAAGIASAIGEPGRALDNLERIPTRSVIARQDLLTLEAEVHRAASSVELDLTEGAAGSSAAGDSTRR